MKTRVITGIVLALVLIPLFVLGGMPLHILLVLLTLGASYEFFQLYNSKEQLPIWIGILYMIASSMMYVVMGGYFINELALEWTLILLLAVLLTASFLLVFVPEYDGKRAGEMLFSILYPAIGFASIYALRDNGIYVIGFLFLITISTDIFAYIVGINFGKHRLAVNISPKKSIEGSIGGTAAAILLTTGYVYIVGLDMIESIELSLWITIVLVTVLSIVGQIGDLVASKIKRQMGIKDFSNIFPGHGGVMDRFDSILLAAILVMFVSLMVDVL